MDNEKEIYWYWPEIICLIVQGSLTIMATLKIMDNRDQFPIKQLGPFSTLVALYCFLISNILNITGRIIQSTNSYYDFDSPKQSQCRTQHTQLFILGLLFNFFKELPFVIFSLKTLRVSICFWRFFNRKDVENIYRWFIGLFRNEAYIIYASIVYVVVLDLLMFGIYNDFQSSQINHFYFEYFCPRQGTPLEIVVSSLRVLMIGFVFYLSIWTYSSLDFKKFLIAIFLISNLVFIPRIYMLTIIHDSDGNQGQERDLTKTTYHQFYFTSFLVSLLETIVTAYYSTKKQQLNSPPMQGVLQSWEAFHNLKLGMIILQDYAVYRDETTEIIYHYRCLQSYNFLDQLLKYAKIAQNFKLSLFFQPIERILELNDLVKLKLGATTTILKKKCRDGSLELRDVKKIEKVLSDFCEIVIFEEWKKTRSYRYLKQEFVANGDINQKMELFDIPLS